MAAHRRARLSAGLMHRNQTEFHARVASEERNKRPSIDAMQSFAVFRPCCKSDSIAFASTSASCHGFQLNLGILLDVYFHCQSQCSPGFGPGEVKTPLDIYLQRHSPISPDLWLHYSRLSARYINRHVPGADISLYPVSSYLSKWIKPGAKYAP